jgi:hypothetical protein
MLVTVLPPAYGTKPPKPSLLTPEELAFAKAVGVGEYAYEVNERLAYDFGCMTDELGRELWRPTGSDAEEECANWLVEEMTRIGLQNVAKEPFPCHGYTFRGAYVQVVEPSEGPKWLACGHGGLPGTTKSPYAAEDGSITAEIVYVGLGRKQDYEGKDVKGKLVAVDVSEDEMYWLNLPHYEAELHGAIGLVVHWIIPGYQDLPGSVTTHDSECRPTIPALCISHRDFATLKALIEAGTTKVKIWCDAEVTIPDTGYNVVGYIPGTTHPDELIILGAIYDKWWYGAHHHMSDVAAMMQVAQALIASGYKPNRTIVFVAIGAEEYGWTDTLFAWAIGSHYTAHYNHSDWGGRARVFIELGGSLKGDYTVRMSGDPLTYNWRLKMLPVFDEFFTTHEPWSNYYRPSSTFFGGLPGTWTDQWNYGTSGISWMSCRSRGGTGYAGVYHVNNDTMEIVSAEALAMNAIANGLNTIRLDRALFTPYNFANWADLIEGTLDEEAITSAGISTGPIYTALDKFQRTGQGVWDLIKSTKKSKNADAANALLMQTAKELFSKLIIVGGWGDEEMLIHEHYQVDTKQLREALEALEEGNVDKAIWALADVYAGYFAFQVDYEVYYHYFIEGTSPGYSGLNWAEGRVATYTDVYHEINSLLEKKATGNMDYSDEIASLQPKYQASVENLKNALKTLTETLSTATSLLKAVNALLK